MLRQGAAECVNFCSICIKLQPLANVIINAGFVMIQSARVGVGRFAEGVRARDFPLHTVFLGLRRVSTPIAVSLDKYKKIIKKLIIRYK